jgi:hypothetical protein
MRHPHGATVTLLRAAMVLDPYSQELTQAAWDDEDHPPTSLEIPRCAIDGSRTREVNTVDRGAVVTDFVIYPDAVYDVLPTDRLIVNGLVCEIVGRPWAPENPFNGDTPGMEIAANIWEG